MKLFFGLLWLPFVLCANLPTESSLIVGTTSGYAPFVSLNEKGDYEGFDIDIAEALAKKLGKKVLIKDFGGMPGLLLALKQGKVDVVIWAVSITEPRMKTMEMVYYQGERVEEMPVIFWDKAPQEIQSFGDLAKKKVTVEAGSYQESVLSKYPKINLKQIDKVYDAILELKYGKAYASCIDASLYPQLKKRYPQLQQKMLPLAPDERSLGNGICINKSNQTLTKDVKQAITELQEAGEIAELEKKWGLSQ